MSGGIEFMQSLLLRVKNIIIHPRDEWRVIREEPATYSAVIRYAAVLATLPPLAAVAGRFVFDGNIQANKVAFSLAFILLTNLLWYCMYIFNIAVAGAIIAAIVTTPASRLNGVQGLTIAAYSFTPLFIAGFVAVIPGMGWVLDVAVVYSLYLLYLGIIALPAMGRGRALGYTVASFLSAAVIVGVMNLLEYYFESLIMNRLVS